MESGKCGYFVSGGDQNEVENVISRQYCNHLWLVLPEDEPGERVPGEVLQLQEDGGQGEGGEEEGREAGKVRYDELGLLILHYLFQLGKR